MKTISSLFLILTLLGGVPIAGATVLTGQFTGIVLDASGDNARVRSGDVVRGTVSLDNSYDYNRRIGRPSNNARFVYFAYDVYNNGIPTTPPPPLPITLSFEVLRSGSLFQMPNPAWEYDYDAMAPTAAIDFTQEDTGDVIVFGLNWSFEAYSQLVLVGQPGSMIDEISNSLIDSFHGSPDPARSSAIFSSDGVSFNVGLTSLRFDSFSVPEPGMASLALLGLSLAGIGRRMSHHAAGRLTLGLK